jgi:hypothetical protein
MIALALLTALPGCPGTALGGYEAPPLQSGVEYLFEGAGGSSVIGAIQNFGPGSWVQIKERASQGGGVAWVNLEQTANITLWD